MTVVLKGAFLQNAHNLTIADASGVTWAFDATTNTLSVSGLSGVGLAADSVANSNLANMSQSTIKGRAAGAGSGDPTDLTAAQVKTVLALIASDISDFNEAAQDAVMGASVDSASIDITYTDASNNWTATVLPAGVNHNLLLNYVADQHVAHSAVTLTAGAGLTGGGDISANRTFDVGAGTGIAVSANDVAIDLAANLTWTGLPTFANSLGIKVASTDVVVEMNDTDGASDAKVWWFRANGGAWSLQTRTDALGAGSAAIVVGRAGAAISSIELGNTTDNPTFATLGTGASTLGGSLKVVGNSGFNNTAPIAKPTVTGSRGGNAALASLLTALADYGLITDGTSA
jgi:hypothetical protein